MFKLNIPPGITLRNASVPKVIDNIRVIVGSEEVIYDQTYVSAVVNERLVKFLKDSVSYK